MSFAENFLLKANGGSKIAWNYEKKWKEKRWAHINYFINIFDHDKEEDIFMGR